MNNEPIKIALTGHGSGGHFYPLIAVAESLYTNPQPVNITYYGPDEFDKEALDKLAISFKKIPAGKRRTYVSWRNFFDLFKIAWGVFIGFFVIAKDYPDVIFSKGGHGAFPAVIASKILRIPLVIHDSDIVPGRVSKISAKWAKRVALAWPQAVEHIDNPKTAVVGIPIRNTLKNATREGGRTFLNIPPELPVLLILGGSQGAQLINQAVIESLPKLLENFYVIHQVGKNNYNDISDTVDKLRDKDQIGRYKLIDSLNAISMSRALGAADIAITRAGATTIFEIALIGKIPQIIIPITQSVNNHQIKNAYATQEAGAGIVIEESNLKPDILIHNIENLLADKQKYQQMSEAAAKFSNLDAADKIANELVQIANQH